jgi:hypothetical protein
MNRTSCTSAITRDHSPASHRPRCGCEGDGSSCGGTAMSRIQEYVRPAGLSAAGRENCGTLRNVTGIPLRPSLAGRDAEVAALDEQLARSGATSSARCRHCAGDVPQRLRAVPCSPVRQIRDLSDNGTASGESELKTAGLPSVAARIPEECWWPQGSVGGRDRDQSVSVPAQGRGRGQLAACRLAATPQ